MKLKISRKKTDNSELYFSLKGEMSVYTVTKLKEFLTGELESSSGLRLELTGVDEADSAAFQLLLYLKREAENAGKFFHVTGMNSRLKSIFTLYKEIV